MEIIAGGCNVLSYGGSSVFNLPDTNMAGDVGIQLCCLAHGTC